MLADDVGSTMLVRVMDAFYSCWDNIMTGALNWRHTASALTARSLTTPTEFSHVCLKSEWKLNGS